MATCRECGRAGKSAARFCTRCGAPIPLPDSTPPFATPADTPANTPVNTNPHRYPMQMPYASPPAASSRQSRNTLLGVFAAAIAVLAVVATIAFLNRPTMSGDSSAAPDQQAVVGAPTPQTYDDTTEPQTETQTETETVTEDPASIQAEPATPQAALAELRRLLREDRPAVEALADQWVPQLSAKRPGLVANGITYNYVEILRDFRTIHARYPDALLLFSGEYSSFKYGNFWITVVPLPQFDGESANAWCDSEGIGPDDCYAKMISHTVGYDGATLLRGS